jgi:hypothetical protein
MITLQPLRFPRPVPIPIWTDDYADIPERIRRTGRFDTEDIWLATSGDGWHAFCGRHGVQDFYHDFRQLAERARTGVIKAKQRDQQDRWRRSAEQARHQQEKWEAERRERELAKQAKADREWQDIENSKEYWSRRHRAYAAETYHIVNVKVAGRIDGVELQAGKSYWLPHSILRRLFAYAKTHNLDTVT